ncbi:MAG: hypothetical protein EPO63_06190 [Candidatus Nitrosotenuis sp.]|nr:MAG: hypothetical protein EPO63_06190 [Candidatus Nitrosotenuis sp.]
MGKILYVRSFDDDLHDEINEAARKEGTTPAAILEDAIKAWREQKGRDRKKHHLLLYSDKESLQRFLKKLDNASKENWFQAFNADENESSSIFLKKLGWADITPKQKEKTPKQYFDNITKTLETKPNQKPICVVGFAHPPSVSVINNFEKEYNTRRLRGVAICTYDSKDLAGSSFDDIIELFEEHDKIFILKKDDFYELSITKENFLKKIF